MPFFVREKKKQSADKKKTSDTTQTNSSEPNTLYHSGQNQSCYSVATSPPPYSPPPSQQYLRVPEAPAQPTRYSSYPRPQSHDDHHLSPQWQVAPIVPSTDFGSARPYLQHFAWKSCTNLTTAVSNSKETVNNKTAQYLNRSAGLYNLISTKFDDVISLIDEGVFTGGEKELTITYQEPIQALGIGSPDEGNASGLRGGGYRAREKTTKGANQAITSVVTSTNYFSKADLYANSRLPSNLPPLHVYMPTYPLICLAAQYSQRVYTRPRGKEKDTHVEANWRMGTKAMVIKSVPVDDMNTIVFAIRGSQTFMDWAVNLHSAPTSPTNFLDDPGNLCHAGFLEVARKMVKPVAARLRQLLEDDPGRASCSLLITGHSAGGAVASLLFCHMLSEVVQSELSILTGCFKRVHCITFGAPPVSLLPLQKPANRERHLRKSLFMSFINEGDPVPRADRPYIKSLLELCASPAPKPATRPLMPPHGGQVSTNKLASSSKLDLTLNAFTGIKKKASRLNLNQSPSTGSLPYSNIVWSVPSSTLSDAGRLVVLRCPYDKNGQRDETDVRAYVTTDEQMRTVMFGQPLAHQMDLYAQRVETLAKKAVTGRLHGQDSK